MSCSSEAVLVCQASTAGLLVCFRDRKYMKRRLQVLLKEDVKDVTCIMATCTCICIRELVSKVSLAREVFETIHLARAEASTQWVSFLEYLVTFERKMPHCIEACII